MGSFNYQESEEWTKFAEAFIETNGNYKAAAEIAGIPVANVYANKARSKHFREWLKEAVNKGLRDKVLKDRIKLSKTDELNSAERQTMALRLKLTGDLNEKPEVHVHNNNNTYVFSDDQKEGLLDWGRNTGRLKLNEEVGRG